MKDVILFVGNFILFIVLPFLPQLVCTAHSGGSWGDGRLEEGRQNR